MAFKQYRALSPEFRTHMDRLNAWPPYGTARQWFEKHAGGMKNESYRRLKDGMSVPEKYPLGLLRMLLDPVEKGRVAQLSDSHCWSSLDLFLRTRGIDNPGLEQLDAAAELACSPVVTGPEKDRIDYLADLKAMIQASLANKIKLGSALRRCADETAVREAVRWMFIDFGRHVSQRPRLPWEQAIRSAEHRQRITLEKYQNQAVAWWKFNPWTVVFSKYKKATAGMSIVFPVKLRTYNAILRGERNTYDCTADDLEAQSPLVVVEAVAPRPVEMSVDGENATLSMLLSLAAQVGALSRCDRLDKNQPLRMLSFAALPVTRKRLTSQGFRATGVLMANSDMEVLEKELCVSSLESHDAFFFAIINLFSKNLDSPPPD